MKALLLLIFAVFIVMNTSLVSAQALDDAFSALDDIGLINSFEKYPQIWDAIILLWLLIVMGRQTLGKSLNSVSAGGTIGAVVALMSIGGMQIWGFSLIRDFGIWVVIFAFTFMLISIMRLFIRGENRTQASALGVAVVTSFLVGYRDIGEYIKELSPLLYSLVLLIWLISIVMSFVWAIGWTANTATGTVNAARNLFNNFRGNRNPQGPGNQGGQGGNQPPTPQQANQLIAQVQQFNTAVTQFVGQVNQLRTLHQNYVPNINPASFNNVIQRINTYPQAQQQQAFANYINGYNQLIIPINQQVGQLHQTLANIQTDNAFGGLDAQTQNTFATAVQNFVQAQGVLAQLVR